MSRFRRIVFIISAGFLVPAIVFSQEIVMHPKGAIHEGNYVRMAETIDLKGDVTQDAILIGRTITIRGSVGGDVLAIGQTITIDSPVGGNIRVIGERVSIGAQAGKNATIAAASLTLSDSSIIGWDLWAMGDAVSIGGSVGGSAMLKGQTIFLNAAVARGVIIEAWKTMSVGAKARVGSSFAYRAPQQAAVEPGATIPPGGFQPLSQEREGTSERSLFWPMVGLFGAWVVGAVLLTIAEPLLKRLSRIMVDELPKVLGWGVVGLLLPPALVVVLLATLIGIPLAILLALVYGILLYCAKIITGFALGNILAQRFGWKISSMMTMVIGVGLYTIVQHVPFVGFAASILGLLVTFGAVTKNLLRASTASSV